MTNKEISSIIWKLIFHGFVDKCAFNKDVLVIFINNKTFVHFWRTELTQEEETFEGAMHKYYY